MDIIESGVKKKEEIIELKKKKASYFAGIDSSRNFETVVGLALVVVLDHRFLEHVHTAILTMPHRYIERQYSDVTTGYVVDVGVEEPEHEAIVLDARLHHPGLPITIVELYGLGLFG